MSTKIKKLYYAKDIKFAQEENKKTERYFTRKTSRRKTVQIRLSQEWYVKIKEVAKMENIMLSFFLDHICKNFFKNY